MRPNGRQFRVFVSSTFSDFKHEREALQERVFPKLHAYCESQGARFQPIDLRWGISEDAARDHQTVRICLEEIRRSQRLSPRPNFIVLLGDRYGWRPIPDEIPAEELELLREHFTAEEQTLLDTWYGRDNNAVPPIYYLRTRPAVMDDAGWEQTQAHLATVLRRAVTTARMPNSERLKYFASATHLEVSEGLLNVPDAGQHVFAYCREIDGIPENPTQSGVANFVDVQDVTRDAEAAAAQSELKTLIRARLPDHTRDYRSRWLHGNICQDHIDTFCADVESDLKAVIDRELEQIETIDPVEWEAEQHREFAAERAQIFVGRQTELAHIANYLTSDSTTPLIVHGPGGAGKSALVAKAVEAISPDGTVIVQRFIGATPESSQLRTLLTGLCRELGRHYGTDETVQYEKLDELFALFESRLELANAEHPLVLVLDSLDQLDPTDMAHQLQWLPAQLPAAVKVIASTRENQTGGEPFLVYQAAERRYQQNLLPIGSLQRDEADQALDALLGEGRTITMDQRAAVLDAFTVRGLPLYLKLVGEQARSWRSDTPVPALPQEVPALIRAFIAQLQAPANHGPVFVERTLAYLQAGRYGGLAEDELARALALDEEVVAEFRARAIQPWNRTELPPILWSRLHADLASYLSEQNIDGALLYRFFHREFSEVIEADSLNGDSGRERHAILAQAFPWHSDPAAFRKANETSVLRQMMEFPYQLLQAAQGNVLKILLTDFNFVFTKCATNRVDDLLNEYFRVDRLLTMTDADFQIWFDFMRSRVHILRRGNTQWPAHKILQQLSIEHADDSPVTCASERWLSAGYCDWKWFRSMRRVNHFKSDPYPIIMEGHTDDIAGVQVLSNGKILSWGGFTDNTLRLWSANGDCIAILEGHTDNVEGVLVLLDGKILSWSNEDTLLLWTSDGIPLAALTGHTDSVRGALELSNGEVLSWSQDHTLRLWEADGKLHAILEGHTCNVINAQGLSSGRLISWTYCNKDSEIDSDYTIGLWSVNGDSITFMEGHTNSIKAVKELSDGNILSWANYDDYIFRLWSANGTLLATLDGHTDRVVGAIELSGNRILSWSEDHTLRIWSQQGTSLAILVGHTDCVIDAKELSNDNIISWAAPKHDLNGTIDNHDYTLRLWSADGAPITILEGHTNFLVDIKELSDGRILSWSQDHALQLWDVENTSVTTLMGDTRSIKEVNELANGHILSRSYTGIQNIWAPDGTLIETKEYPDNNLEELPDGRIITWSSPVGDRLLRLWDSNTTPSNTTGTAHTNTVDGGFELVGERILSWSYGDTSLLLWETNGTPIATLKGHTQAVTGALQISLNRILSWSKDNTLRIWSHEGTLLATLVGHTDYIFGARELSDGVILSWSRDATLRLWTRHGLPFATLKGHSDDISDPLILSNGNILSWTIAFFPNDKTLKLWSAKGTLIASLDGHTDQVVNALELSDGRILSWSKDNTLRIWSHEGTLLSTLAGHTNRVRGAEELADGTILSWSSPTDSIAAITSYGYDPTLRRWNANGTPLAVFSGHTNSVLGAQELANGNILSWSRDHTLRLWNIDGKSIDTLAGHNDYVTHIKILSDGRILSFCSGISITNRDDTPRLWSPVGNLLAILEGHNNTVVFKKELSNGSVLTSSFDGTLRLWELANLQCYRFETEPLKAQKCEQIAAMSYYNYGHCLLLENGTVAAFANGQLKYVLQLHDGSKRIPLIPKG